MGKGIKNIIKHTINYNTRIENNDLFNHSPFTINEIPINIPLIDSLSLKIPFNDCIIIDKRLTSMTSIYYEDLEMISPESEVMPPKPIIVNINGIKVRFSLATIPIYNNETKEKVSTKFIVFTLSAKLLRHRYFEGINKKNIKDLYNEFLSFDIVSCEFDTFINSQVSDIDICINKYVNDSNNFLSMCKRLKTLSGTKRDYVHITSEKTNLGISFNKREFAKPSLPFIKLYHKEFELLYNSAEFYNTYLFREFSNDIKNLTRIEATIKNYAHKKRLSRFNILNDFKTLKDFLEIPIYQLENFVLFSITSYIRKLERLKSPKLSPTEHIIFNLLQNDLKNGASLDTVLFDCTNDFIGTTIESTAVAKSRMKKQIKKLYDLIILKDLKIKAVEKQNQHINNYLEYLLKQLKND